MVEGLVVASSVVTLMRMLIIFYLHTYIAILT